LVLTTTSFENMILVKKEKRKRKEKTFASMKVLLEKLFVPFAF
jgi:hypothetical protein